MLWFEKPNPMYIGTFKTASVIRVEINSPKGALAFDLFAHPRDSAEELVLNKEKFYRPYCGELLFPHFEIEIASTSPPERLLSKAGTHYIKGTDGKLYICWPYRIPDAGATYNIASGWSAAAFHALATGQDSNTTIAHYCGANGAKTFLAGLVEGLERDHGIVIKTMMIR